MDNQLERLCRSIEREISKQKFGKEPGTLYEPIRYLMGLGGKRLRPMLTLLSYSLFKSDIRTILPYAIAVETFHNFTLMHDDIMDKAPLRRGHTTVHEKWNLSTAILSGDVMLVKVYEMFSGLNPKKFKEVIQAFNTCAAEVCEGQQYDMDFETEETIKEAQYINMIKLKTAVLLGFSLELGAILAGANAATRKKLRDFGINIGIGFQLKDDLLDAYADARKFGKQVGGDIIANKKTYLLVKAIELVPEEKASTLQHWLSQKNFDTTEKVQAIKAIYDDLNIPSLTEKKINAYFKKGFNDLDKIKGKVAGKELLRRYTYDLIGRQS